MPSGEQRKRKPPPPPPSKIAGWVGVAIVALVLAGALATLALKLQFCRDFDVGQVFFRRFTSLLALLGIGPCLGIPYAHLSGDQRVADVTPEAHAED
jgi:hypothetical protein